MDDVGSYSQVDLGNLEKIEKEAEKDFSQIKDSSSAEEFRIKWLGKKGILRELLKNIKNIPESERKNYGAKVNTLVKNFEEKFSQGQWKDKKAREDSFFDPTMPGFPYLYGTLHPLMKIRNEIRDIFVTMGFSVSYGPDIETDYYNFEALNMPKFHPARDMQDTFYITSNYLLRTHTSPVQIRVMEQKKPPIRCIMPGRVYRNEEISARSYCLFHQVEGLYIDKNVSFADLKGTLLAFARRFFDKNTKLKIRPSFFPFTEPSVEIDIECFLCKGKGCNICKYSGWLEILGAGMVHPNVLKAGNIDSNIYSGFAFGMGIERIALLKYGIEDIRYFYENDVRFLKQF
ncbi:MAG: phenylalanine--tRNA ligase subunit alpha [Chitinispirillaceae bacterium]|nr:phenylalanine--tRNA ligase subunit alpha [Chitinispirillaceae bacterium]